MGTRGNALVQIKEEAHDEENELDELALAKDGQVVVLKDLRLVQFVLLVNYSEMRGGIGQQ